MPKRASHGVSIGSNDLTQLVLGVDRDSEICAPLYDERDKAVTEAIQSDYQDLPQDGHNLLDLRAGAFQLP